jgi:hypothetical protein
LLRFEEVLVEILGVLERFLHRLLGDLVEHHPAHLVFFPSRRWAMCHAIASPSRSGSGARKHGFLALRGLAELGDDLRLAVDDRVLGLEVVLDVHAELALRQVDDVPDGRLHLVVAP